MLIPVALSVRTSTRTVTATDTATAIGVPPVGTIVALPVKPAGELEQNFGFAPEAMGQRGLVASVATKEDGSR
jgi:hypothetical protein